MLGWLVISCMLERHTTNKSKLLLRFCLFVFLVVVIGFRHEVGGDWFSYLKIFNHIQQTELINSTDIGYGLINLLSPNIYTVNTVSAIFGVTFFFVAMHNFTVRNYSLVILTIFLPFIILSTGFTRQFIAVSAMAACWSFIVKKERSAATCLVVAGGVAHISALPVALGVSWGYLSSKLKLFCIFVLGIVVLIYLHKFLIIYEEYVLFSQKNGARGTFLRLFFLLPSIIWIGRFAKRDVKKDQLILCYAALCLSVLAVPFSTIADRFSYYLILTLPLALHSIGAVKHYRLFVACSLLISLSTFFLWYSYSSYANLYWNNYALWNPFTGKLLTF